MHHPYLLPAPDLAILDTISHCPLFDVFPDNPADPDAKGVYNATVSLNSVLMHKQPHMMPTQRYDIRVRNGDWEERYWKAAHVPVPDDNGEVELIIRNVEDVTTEVGDTTGSS